MAIHEVDPYRWAADRLRLEHTATAVIRALNDHSVPSVLLKGAALAQRLYEPPESRPYLDVDILVPQRRRTEAGDVLRSMGFTDLYAGMDPREHSPHSGDFQLGRTVVDLHWTLVGVKVDPEVVFDVLARRVARVTLLGEPITILADEGLALHLALNAVGTHTGSRAFEDLARGLCKIPRADWLQAMSLAEALGATESLAAGLSIHPEGARLSAELGLPTQWSTEVTLRASGGPTMAASLSSIAATPGVRRKVSLVARKIWPTAAFLRHTSPIARRGTLGLFFAYLARPVGLARRLPAAARALRQSRHEGRR